MARRIFIALDLPPDLKDNVAETIKQWRWLPIRWMAPENWHTTLIPPLYLEEPELDLLTKILEKGRLAKPSHLLFSKILLAPPGVPARMIWLEGETPPELPKLKKKLERMWASANGLPPLPPEGRPPHLHVTLARFEPGELKELEAKTRVLGEVSFSFEAKEISVMESHLKPEGAEYELIATVPI